VGWPANGPFYAIVVDFIPEAANKDSNRNYTVKSTAVFHDDVDDPETKKNQLLHCDYFWGLVVRKR
jgi:hypothetical protein